MLAKYGLNTGAFTRILADIPQGPQIIPRYYRHIFHSCTSRAFRVHSTIGECIPRATGGPEVIYHGELPGQN
jgi:hypothetical protein